MATMTGQVARPFYAVLFWMLAAVLVFAVHVKVEARWPVSGLVATIAAVMACAFAYMGLVAPDADASHALGVGAAWLTLSIAMEIALTTHLGHRWYFILGSPDRPLLRNVLLFVWAFAPVLFSRRSPLPRRP